MLAVVWAFIEILICAHLIGHVVVNYQCEVTCLIRMRYILFLTITTIFEYYVYILLYVIVINVYFGNMNNKNCSLLKLCHLKTVIYRGEHLNSPMPTLTLH